jgi:hypothetical protein
VSGLWAGYTRVSRVGDRGDRLISPELQAARIRAFAVIRDLEVKILEPELDVSGGSKALERPILSQALEGIEEGRYAGIIVAQLDRLSRMDITEALHTIRKIEAARSSFAPTAIPGGRSRTSSAAHLDGGKRSSPTASISGRSTTAARRTAPRTSRSSIAPSSRPRSSATPPRSAAAAPARSSPDSCDAPDADAR